MSVLLGKPFSFPSNQNDITDARLDAKTWMVDTSLNIFNFPKIPGQFFLPRDSGNGFTKNQPCFLSVDGDVILPVALRKHTHSHDTDIDGGLVGEVLLQNIGNLNPYYGNSYYKNDFLIVVSGTGAQVIDGSTTTSYYVEIDSGTATNGIANIRRPMIGIDFSKNSAFVAREEFNGAISNYLLRLGICAEQIDLANDPTEESYGIEACSGQTNWQTWSSNGTTRSTTATVYAVDNNTNVWMGQHYPADGQIIFTRNVDFGANQVTKSSDVPTTGLGASIRTWSQGVKATTSSASKKLRHKGVIIISYIGESSWKWYAT